MIYGKVNWIREGLESLKDENGEAIRFATQILSPIKTSISNLVQRQEIVRQHHSQQTEDTEEPPESFASRESLRDEFFEANDLKEEMLGISLVVCQVYINQFIGALEVFDGHVNRKSGAGLSCLN